MKLNKTRENKIMSYASIKTNDSVQIVNTETGESFTVYSSQKGWDAALEALRNNDFAEFEVIARPAAIFERDYCNGRVTLEDGVVSLDGNEMHGVLADRMIDMVRDGFDIEPLAKFMVNLNENPSNRAVNELYGFLEVSQLAITPDGNFVAYKMIRDDYKDTYSGKMDNSPGSVVEMPRNAVNEDKEQTCSHGLHFCGRGYLGQYPGSRTVILEINPRDVVSIPVDYNNHKGRCCKYTVIGELNNGRGDQDDGRAEQHLEGSVFTGNGLDMVDDWYNELDDDMDDVGTMTFYPSREAARTAANNDPSFKFFDNGPSSPKGERWSTINV
jgi:hypothetical protein